jgi:transposase-like protein
VPWKETQLEKIREEFVLRALEPDANVAELCREYGVSRKTAYKWLSRFKARGVAGLSDLSRRPHSSPIRASGEAVLNVLEHRRAHSRWGPRKLRRVMLREMAPGEVPSERTIARILGPQFDHLPRVNAIVQEVRDHALRAAGRQAWLAFDADPEVPRPRAV